MSFVRPSTSSGLALPNRLRFSLNSQRPSTSKRRLASDYVRIHHQMRYLPVTSLVHSKITEAREELFWNQRGLCTMHSSSSNNKRWFGSAAAPSKKSSRSKKKSKRRHPPGKKSSKKRSSKRQSHHDRRKNAAFKRSGGGHLKAASQAGDTHHENRSSSAATGDTFQRRESGSRSFGNIDGPTTSSAEVSSAVDPWDNDNNTDQGSHRAKRRYPRNDGTGFSRAPRHQRSKYHHHHQTTFHLDRFRDRQSEFCESLEAYRLVWYPASAGEKPSPQDSDDDDESDWRTAMDFCHPDPHENFPWLELSWDTLVESEDLFRRVCASYHDLFVSCASHLADRSEIQSQQQQQQQQQSSRYHHRSEEEEIDWTEMDLLRVDGEELLETILPSWERLRRERALLVERYRPKEICENDESGDSELPPSSIESYDRSGGKPTIATPGRDDTVDVSYQNNPWVGWLKQMITGGSGAGENTEDATSLDRVTAHEDPECAPGHYHYSKLVGRLYFHYLPLEKHNRSNPFHLYSKREREEVQGMPRKNHNEEEEVDDGEASDELLSSDENGPAYYRNTYEKELAAWERQRIEILEERAEKIQYIVDQSLLPLIPNNNHSSSSSNTASKPYHHKEDDSDRVLTDKIVRLLIRSYLDIQSLSAAQQAERVYHRHPNHRKRLLWYVTMCYLKVIAGNNKKMALSSAAATRAAPRALSEAVRKEQHRLFIQRNQESSTAAKRICELVSSKHAKEAREFQHCSTSAFEALAILPQYSRRGLRGYYDRVHSLCILKFGPKVWEALLRDDTGAKQANEEGSNPNFHRRKRKSSRRSSLGASSASVDKTQSQEPAPKPTVDLSQSLHSKDHKILNFLIQIYSHEEKDLPRALRLLKVSLDLYAPHELKKSLDRSTFHKLLRKLSEQRRKASIEEKKLNSSPRHSNAIASNYNNISSEFEIALGLLDGMVSDESWFPNEETFRILFSMIQHCKNPGRDAERLRSQIEVCRFLSGLSVTQSSSLVTNHSEEGHNFAFPEAPYIFNPLESSANTLRAWLQTLRQHGGVVLPGQANPSVRALSILKTLRLKSSSLFHSGLKIDNGNNNETDSDSDTDEETDAKVIAPAFQIGSDPAPTPGIYSLALKVCEKDGGSPGVTLQVALDIFDFLQKDGLLLKASTCRDLLNVLAFFPSTPEEQKLLRARIGAIKQVCEALIKEDPDYGKRKNSVMRKLESIASQLRLRHPDLYEELLASDTLLAGIVESNGDSASGRKGANDAIEDDTIIEGLHGDDNGRQKP